MKSTWKNLRCSLHKILSTSTNPIYRRSKAVEQIVYNIAVIIDIMVCHLNVSHIYFPLFACLISLRLKVFCLQFILASNHRLHFLLPPLPAHFAPALKCGHTSKSTLDYTPHSEFYTLLVAHHSSHMTVQKSKYNVV